MKVAGIIINYRTPEMTGDAVPGLLTELSRAGEAHLFIVDNDSRDGSVEYLRNRARQENWGDRVTVVAAPINGGYGYGINVGAREAMALPEPPEYLYVINSDAVPDPDSLRVLIEFMDRHPSVGITGSRIHLPDGPTQGGAFKFLSVISEFERQAELSVLRKLLARWVAAGELPAGTAPVDWIAGTSMMIRRSTFEQVGPFDEKFFLYFEEIDYCIRARRAGVEIYFVDGAPITHLGSVSTGLEDALKRYPRYWYESRHRYFLKHHGHAYAVACDAAWLAGTAIRRLKHLVRAGKKPERPHHITDFIAASLLHLSKPSSLLQAGGPPKKDERSAEDLPLLEIVLEDVDTYDWRFSKPGFWAVTATRLRDAARRADSRVGRKALKAAQRALETTVDLTSGIRIPEGARLGRRVLLQNSGGMLLNARSIGNDVSIAEDTTFGPLTGVDADEDELPIVADGVEIGSGVSVLGPITLENGVVVEPNSVVLKHAPANSTMLGVPAEAR